jgi:DNA-directed RNA polymerase
MQHLSMMRRSKNEVRVNLLPMDTISDVYATVARLVAQRIYADASRTDCSENEVWKGEVARIRL